MFFCNGHWHGESTETSKCRHHSKHGTLEFFGSTAKVLIFTERYLIQFPSAHCRRTIFGGISNTNRRVVSLTTCSLQTNTNISLQISLAKVNELCLCLSGHCRSLMVPYIVVWLCKHSLRTESQRLLQNGFLFCPTISIGLLIVSVVRVEEAKVAV